MNRHPFPSPIRCFHLVLILFVATAAFADETARTENAFPEQLVKLMPYQGNPVFTASGPGNWDERIRERGWILREGSNWRMWYTGYQPGGQMKLGYATSTDGIAWQRHDANPIYDEHWVEDMTVVPHEGKYYMFAEGRNDQAHLLESNDGIRWKRIGPLDVRLKGGEPIPAGPFGTPTVWLGNGVWHLLYERRDDGVWLATSTDLKTWTNVQDEPVMVPGPGSYDSKKIAVNQVVSFEDRFYVYYHGLGETAGNWTTNIATSTDLVHWTKYESNPLLPVESNKSSGIMVLDGNQLRVYTMHNQVHLHFPRR